MSVQPDAHRRYESFDPFCASSTMTPKEGSVGVAGEAVCSGGSPSRERHVDLQTGRFRILILRNFGALFRTRTRKRFDLKYAEVLRGSAISNSNAEGFELSF